MSSDASKTDSKPTSRENRTCSIEAWTKLLGVLVACGTLGFGIWEYSENAKRTAETRRLEAARPYLDRQLTLYTEATKTTAIIATSKNDDEIEKATRRFQELYWGELALVEHGNVAGTMMAFKDGLDTKKPQDALAMLALQLAYACRDELAASWGTDAWKR